ncbi:DNA-directed DNA polymerase [Melia azedarach]|uniref:DNA-directed DNA polymerase n=1 Tax=Melia azedarach TaxID=155640 RepID=A0ACC1YNR5_MELAZ|nr:DNA-directed DNA polymerase [Melia azedarach]
MEIRNRFNKNEVRLDNMETHMVNIGANVKSSEVHVGQLATSIKSLYSGKSLSETEVNPIEQCMVITLRSGKELEPLKCKENEAMDNKMKESEVIRKKVAKEVLKEVSKPHGISFPDNPPIITPPFPFSHRFQKKKLDDQFSKFLEMFKKLYVNIPFANALEQIPNYLKFMKEVISKKQHLEEYEMVKLTEECSSLIQRTLPKKEKDSGTFIIPCTIGKSNFERALCDLGASFNLMSLLTFRRLGLGEVKPTTISL